MYYSSYQSNYFAHWLSLSGHYEESLTKTIASAKVDMNPHQVQAALFALRSPLSKGVILADEVGLGKTIEACLVLAQRWAEQKRKLLLIVPATLRKQWSQELRDKFELPSVILEAKNFNQAKKQGIANPFDLAEWQETAIVICSYEFAAAKEIELSRFSWDLVVLDEAHKLRNIYQKTGAKIAKKLHQALLNRPKILMTATPLQNSLLELYGLVFFIDPYFFGNLDAFKTRYSRKNVEPAEQHLLRQRLSHIINRTLRRQVQETGRFNFTRRYSLTEDFCPLEAELRLYEQVSAFLKRKNLLAIQSTARHLVALVIRKILASSSYALQGTLETMIQRLQDKRSLIEGLQQDFEAMQELDDTNTSHRQAIDTLALKKEMDELSRFKRMAEDITQNAKADALQRVLSRAFAMTERLGGAHKAVIFTESIRTQQWLFELLSQQGFDDQIVLLNGSNNDPHSKKIYQAWQQKHQGTVHISGSKASDMKAALVEQFRDQATLMISTEAGAEGINLPFCSLLIHYDLPWNPQRVEQRIGRVHRYGQKYDVVVVNFINKGNYADERVFQLFNEKFKLFEGVFGASDDILASIQSGVDIEKRINTIYQQCRSHEEIEQAFNDLQQELKHDLAHVAKKTAHSVFEYVDTDVIKRLNRQQQTTAQKLTKYQHMMMRLAKAERPSATFSQDHFQYQGVDYDLSWRLAETNNEQFFRPNEGLGKQLIEEGKAHDTTKTVHLTLNYALLESQLADLRPYIDQSGELIVEKYTIETSKQKQEYLLIAACSDAGQVLEVKTARRLLRVPCSSQSHNPVASFVHQQPLQEALQTQVAQYFAQAERDNEQYYEEEIEKLEHWSSDCKIALAIKIRQLDREIAEARRFSRQRPSLKEKIKAKRALKHLEHERDQAMLDYHEEKKKIEAEEEHFLEAFEQALEMTHHSQPLFRLRWTLKEQV